MNEFLNNTLPYVEQTPEEFYGLDEPSKVVIIQLLLSTKVDTPHLQTLTKAQIKFRAAAEQAALKGEDKRFGYAQGIIENRPETVDHLLYNEFNEKLRQGYTVEKALNRVNTVYLSEMD